MFSVATGSFYLVWHWQYINWNAWYYSFPFFLAEIIGLLLFVFFAVNAWLLRYHAPEGVAIERTFSVDVFIPVAGEPIGLVRKTVEAALRIDFENKRIYILDDKGDAEYRRIAERSGCGYFAREDHHDAKAGNLNYAFGRTEGDLILALDADQVPHPEIINKLIGYFKIPKIAFVQSKQDFIVPAGDPFGNTDRIFYNVMQSGKDNDNSAFSCGSGVIYLREALREIGGFSTWNLVEDVHTSMLLHERGWRSVYYNHPLSRGTAPADVYGVYRQRKQWAADSLRILFWNNPFHRKGLTFKQKLQYFNLGFVYLVAAFVMPFFFITPILSLLAGQFILTVPVQQYVFYRFPYFIAMSLAYGMVNYPTPYMKAFQMWTGLFPVFIQATWVALRSRKKKPVYHVNVKTVAAVRTKNPVVAVLPQLGIIIFGIFSIVYAFFNGAARSDFYLLNVVWIIWSMWTMSGICLAAIGKHTWSGEEAQETAKVPSFFSKTRELVLTVALTLVVAIFFTISEKSSMDKFMSRMRFEFLKTPSLKKPAVRIYKENPEAVEVTVPPLETTEEIQPGEMKEDDAESNLWMVQVISVKTQKRATIFKEQLAAASFPAYAFPSHINGDGWIRVRVGFYKSAEEARDVGRRIQGSTFTDKGPYWIMQISAAEKESLRGK